MKVYVDLDIFIYKVIASLQPSYYWVGLEHFKTKKEATQFCNENSIELTEIVKQECIEPPWRVSYAIKRVIENLEEKIHKVTGNKTESITYFLSGDNNFRKEVDIEYKAQRPEKPFYTAYVKECLYEHCNAISCPGLEADDLLALAAEQDLENSLIVSIDKDLLNIPTNHYNPDTQAICTIEHIDGFYSFLKQCVTGDTVDNIKGIAGMGPRAADAILDSMDGCNWEVFLEALETHCNEKGKEFNRQRVETDATLLDVGLYWSRKLKLPIPELALPLFKEAWKVVKGL